VNGEQVKDARELARTIGGISPGTTVKLNVLHKARTSHQPDSASSNTVEAKADNDNDESRRRHPRHRCAEARA